LVPANVKIFTISELTQAIKNLLEEGLPSVWLTGEITNLSRPVSGHLYFTLKDARAQIRCVAWKSAASRFRFTLEDGLAVIASGRLSVYEPRGEYQLYVERLQPTGVGALELAFRELHDKLAQLGWLDKSRKRPLPAMPRRLALVTSPSGAAVRDVLEILGRCWPLAEVWVVPTRVQGDEAADEIAAALARISRLQQAGHAIDLALLARGGGGLEDLWAFNQERVAEAILRCAVPVVSGIGHEIDVTIADLVADVRAATPSEAAERAVPDRLDVLERLKRLGTRLHELLRQRRDQGRLRLDQLRQRPVLLRPLERVHERQRQLDDLNARLTRAALSLAPRFAHRFDSLGVRLLACSPARIVERIGENLRRFAHALRSALDARIELARERLKGQTDRRVLLQPDTRLFEARRRLEEQNEQLNRAVQTLLARWHRQLTAQAATLDALSPLKVLARGYSVTRIERDGSVLRDPGQVRPGDRLETRVAGGLVHSRVEAEPPAADLFAAFDTDGRSSRGAANA
jgi:exodeoxyribonuclease VII large subunit